MSRRGQVLAKAWSFQVATVITFNILPPHSSTEKTLAWNNLNLLLVLRQLHFKIFGKKPRMRI